MYRYDSVLPLIPAQPFGDAYMLYNFDALLIRSTKLASWSTPFRRCIVLHERYGLASRQMSLPYPGEVQVLQHRAGPAFVFSFGLGCRFSHSVQLMFHVRSLQICFYREDMGAIISNGKYASGSFTRV